MPGGTPLTEVERRAQHKAFYGSESEPPVERIGRPGGRAGIPRTDDERRALHELYYGTSPPAVRGGAALMTEEDARLLHEQYYGVPPGMMVECIGPECILVPVPMEGEKLVIITGSVLAFIVAHKIILIVLIIASSAVLYAGLSAAYAIWERAKRKGLPSFQMTVAAPKPEYIDDPDAKYAFGIVGAVPGRRVSVKFGKEKYFGYADPIFRQCVANARGECLIEATGREIAEAAKHRKFLVGSLPLMGESGNVTVSMYAQEDRRMLHRDITTPIEPVRIHIASRSEELMRSIPCFVPPHAVLPEDAAAGFAVGKPYYIKFAIPMMCCFPGLPYTPGMWVPPGFVISENP